MTESKDIGTVMIVDDEEFDRRCTKRVLEKSGLVNGIICFAYPDDALTFLGQPDRPEIDVILLDINMPRLSGFEFLEQATNRFGDHFAKSVVIMLTTSLASADTAKAQQFSIIKDYFDKPLLPAHVPRVCQLVRSTEA